MMPAPSIASRRHPHAGGLILVRALCRSLSQMPVPLFDTTTPIAPLRFHGSRDKLTYEHVGCNSRLDEARRTMPCTS